MSASDVNPETSATLEAGAVQLQAASEMRAALRGVRGAQGAPVRRRFASDESAPSTPLARLLSGDAGRGGGRGGHVRIKVLLSLLWVCAAAPYRTYRPASAFAALIGLEDYQSRGTRRVQQALRDLADRNFIRLTSRGAHAPEITLLSELGNGTPYESPVAAYNRLSRRDDTDRQQLAQHLYFRVPGSFWARGWIAKLSGAGLAMYLAMLAELSPTSSEVWFSPARAEDRFGIAASTRKAGIKELRELGMVSTTSRVVSTTGRFIDELRRRNVYRVEVL